MNNTGEVSFTDKAALENARIMEIFKRLEQRFASESELSQERDKRYDERLASSSMAVRIALDSQKELVSAAFASQRSAVEAAMQASDKAILKSETAMLLRFDAVNEFRKTLADQQATLIPRSEALVHYTRFEQQIGELKKEIAVLRECRSEGVGDKTGRKDNFFFLCHPFFYRRLVLLVL